MGREKSVGQSIILLESFPPTAWRESSYIERPPFVAEDIDGSYLVIPMSGEAERVLDGVHAPFGLKKVNGNQPFYLTSRDDATRALRIFDWFVRKS